MKRFDGTRFLPERWIRRLAIPEQVDNAVDALLHHSRALVPDVSAVVVVTEENQATDVLGFPAHPRMIAENLDSARVTFWPVGRARAIAILGDHDRLIGKSLMNLLQIVSQ